MINNTIVIKEMEQMRLGKKAKKQRGSSLAIVMVLLTVMLVLGTGMVSFSINRAMQSKSAVKMDQQYYAAEAAAQVASQMLMRELKATDFYVAGATNTPTAWLTDEFYDNMNDKLEALYDSVNAEVTDESDTPKFNGQKTVLKAVAIKDIDIEDIDSHLDVYVDNDTAMATVYLKDPTFVIAIEAYDIAYDADGEPLKSGSRTVMAEVPVKTVDESGKLLSHLGGLQSDKNEGIYNGGSNELYDTYMEGLAELLQKSDEDYAIKSIESNVIPDPNFPTTAQTWNGDKNVEYINQYGALTLPAGDYPNLKYIKTAGNPLTITGTVNCPELKGAWVNGLNIGSSNSNPGTFNCRSLEAAHVGSAGVRVYRGSAINPMKVDAYGKVTDYNKPITPSGSCNFYTNNGMMTVNCSAEVNWCKFNVSHVEIAYGTGGKLTSNSIFISRDWVKITGTASSDTNRVIPQFYSRGYIDFSGSNPGNVTGIFMTPGNNAMFNNGNDISDNVQFTGLFVGNCDVGQTIPPPDYWGRVPIGQYYDNGQPRDDFAVLDFDADTYELLMDGDWLVKNNSNGKPIPMLGFNKGITIREGKS